MTNRQCVAARALLGWGQVNLAHEAGTALSTVADFERGARKPQAKNMTAMLGAFQAAGVLFLGDTGVILAD